MDSKNLAIGVLSTTRGHPPGRPDPGEHPSRAGPRLPT